LAWLAKSATDSKLLMFRDPEKQPAGVNFTFPLVTVVLAEIHGFTLVVD